MFCFVQNYENIKFIKFNPLNIKKKKVSTRMPIISKIF